MAVLTYRSSLLQRDKNCQGSFYIVNPSIGHESRKKTGRGDNLPVALRRCETKKLLKIGLVDLSNK